jgi:hypothetical protein
VFYYLYYPQKMGRPLYSKALYDRKPAAHVVRTVPEPQPAYPVYDRWTPNQLDPDSDDWFERSDVVYEAFLDPQELETSRGESARRTADGLIDALDGNSSGSEGSESGRTSPTGIDMEEPVIAPVEIRDTTAEDRPSTVEAPADRRDYELGADIRFVISLGSYIIQLLK